MSTITKAMQAQQNRQDKIDALKYLITQVTPNPQTGKIEVFSILRHVSASGMTRVIDSYIIINGMPHHVGYLIAQILDWKYDREREGIKVTGCGMDMGFHVVSTLSRVLYDNDYYLTNRWL